MAPLVVTAILSKLQGGEFWTGIAEALKTSRAYLDVMDLPALTSVIQATLSLLEGIDPAREVWPIVRPALDLLATQEACRVWGQSEGLGQEIVAAILRFGLNQKTEHLSLLFYLYQFAPASVREQPTKSELDEVVRDVRKRALAINASDAVDNIRGLLLASAVSV